MNYAKPMASARLDENQPIETKYVTNNKTIQAGDSETGHEKKSKPKEIIVERTANTNSL
jgi:hypothetical protein